MPRCKTCGLEDPTYYKKRLEDLVNCEAAATSIKMKTIENIVQQLAQLEIYVAIGILGDGSLKVYKSPTVGE